MNARQLRQRADSLVAAGQLQAAGRLIDEARALQPFDTDLLLAMANVMLAGRQYEQAARVLRDLLKRRPEVADAHFLLGNALRARRRPGEAAECYQRVLALEPRYPGAHHYLGLALQQAGELEAAARALARACELRPEMTAPRFRLGAVLHLLGRHGPAIAAYQRVLKQAPDHHGALTNLALALLAEERDQEALDVARQHTRRAPGHAMALANLLYAAMGAGDDALAGELLAPRLLHREPLGAGQEDRPRWLAAQAAALEALGPASGAAVPPDRGFASREFGVGDHPHIDPLLAEAETAVARRLQALREGTDHPWVRDLPAHWQLRAWAEVRGPREEEPTHCHPRAVLCGLVYLRARAGETGAELVFGVGDEAYRHLGPRSPLRVPLEDGRLLLFPAYWFHRASPCPPGERRVALAFDVLARPAPDSRGGARPPEPQPTPT